MVNSKKNKTKEDNISIKEYQKKIPRPESERRRYYIIFVLVLLIIATLILVGKFGPSFFSFIAFIVILVFPMIFVFDTNISQWYFSNKGDDDDDDDDDDDKKKKRKTQMESTLGTKLSPKNQDIMVIVSMCFLCFIGIIILFKANKSLFNISMAAVAFGTAGVLSSYGLSDKAYIIRKKKPKKDAIKYDHTHKIGPLETSSGKRKRNLSNN